MNDLKHQTCNLAAWTRNPPWLAGFMGLGAGQLYFHSRLDLDFEMQVDLPQSSDQRHPWPGEFKF